MSRIGNMPIVIPEEVQVEINNGQLIVKGGKGELKFTLPKELVSEKKDKTLLIKRKKKDKKSKSFHGLYRSLINNAVIGVDKPWEKRLEIVGTGYNVQLQGENLQFKVGYSHKIVFKKVDGVNFKVDGGNKVVVSGVDKQLVGQVAYQIKKIRKPDPYKGKGIRYQGEKIKLKPGKKAKTVDA